MFAWILFRAQSFSDAGIFFRRLWGASGNQVFLEPLAWVAIAVVVGQHLLGWLRERNPSLGTNTSPWLRASYYALLIVFVYHAMPDEANPFIYFRF